MLIFGYGGHDLKDSLAWAVGSEAAARAIAEQTGANEFKGCACFLPAYPTNAPTLRIAPKVLLPGSGRKEGRKDTLRQK